MKSLRQVSWPSFPSLLIDFLAILIGFLAIFTVCHQINNKHCEIPFGSERVHCLLMKLSI